jgi:putative spermidine/putrescine transport system ATP-binding protein
MIRPHRIRLEPSTGNGSVRGRVNGLTYLGDLVQYDVALGETQITIERPSEGGSGKRFERGDEVNLVWDPRDVLVFEGDAQAP